MANWAHRNLTILGWITLINSLLNSLFMHKLLALPSPPPAFFTKYRKIIRNFLWDGSSPKVAYSKLIQDYNHLGLKLVDLEVKDAALKASWPVKMKDKKSDEVDWMYTNYPI